MEKVRFINYKGSKLLYTDFTDLSAKEILKLCEYSKSLMRQQAPDSVFSLINVEKIKFNTDVINAIKETARHNKPFVRASAVYGIDGFLKVLINVVTSFSGREMKIFSTLDEAKEWLSSKANKDVKIAA